MNFQVIHAAREQGFFNPDGRICDVFGVGLGSIRHEFVLKVKQDYQVDSRTIGMNRLAAPMVHQATEIAIRRSALYLFECSDESAFYYPYHISDRVGEFPESGHGMVITGTLMLVVCMFTCTMFWTFTSKNVEHRYTLLQYAGIVYEIPTMMCGRRCYCCERSPWVSVMHCNDVSAVPNSLSFTATSAVRLFRGCLVGFTRFTTHMMSSIISMLLNRFGVLFILDDLFEYIDIHCVAMTMRTARNARTEVQGGATGVGRRHYVLTKHLSFSDDRVTVI